MKRFSMSRGFHRPRLRRSSGTRKRQWCRNRPLSELAMAFTCDPLRALKVHFYSLFPEGS